MRADAGGARVSSYRLLLAVVAATVLTSCGSGTLENMQQPAPAAIFVTIKGEQIPVSALRGKVVLVNFWATDCAVCLKEMPALVAMHQKYQARGLETVAVAMRHDMPLRVVDYAEKAALPFKVAFDPVGAHAKAFGNVTLTPTTFIIDKRGNIVSRILGEPDFKKLHELLEKKLAEPA